MSAEIRPNFETLPIHEVQEKIHEDKERELRWANKDNITAHYVFWGSIIKAIQWSLNLYIRIWGPRGLGKSETAMSIAVGIHNIARKLGLKAKIITTFSFEKTLEVLTELSKILDKMRDEQGNVKSDTVFVIVQDEMSYLMGEGSINTMRAIINILNQARVARVFLIIISPRREEFGQLSGHADIILEAKRRENTLRMNQLRLWTRTEWPVGWLYIPLHRYEKLRERYEKAKWDNLLKLMAQGGISKATSTQMFHEIAQKFIKYVQEKNIPLTPRKLMEAFEDFVIDFNIPFITTKTYERAKGYCVRKALAEITESQPTEVNKDIFGRPSGELIFKKTQEIDDIEFVNEVYKAAIEIFEGRKISFYKLRREMIDAWYDYYYKGMTMDATADKYGLNHETTLTNAYKSGGWFSVVREEILGYAVEIALTRTYLKGFKVVGGNNPNMPDLINGETPEKSDVWVEVKSRHRDTYPTADMINRAEREFLQQNRGELYLIIFILRKKSAPGGPRVISSLRTYEVILREKQEEKEEQKE